MEVCVTVLFLKPEFPDKVQFIRHYYAEIEDRNQFPDVEALFRQAFHVANPTFKILEVKVNGEK